SSTWPPSASENIRHSVRHHGLGGRRADRTQGRDRGCVLAHQELRRHPRAHGRVHAGLPGRPLVREGAHPFLHRGRTAYRAEGRPQVHAQGGHELPGRGQRGAAPLVYQGRRQAVHRRLRGTAMIDSKEKLRAAYPPAKERSVKKQLAHLDKHCLRFVSLSPFVVLSSGTLEGGFDASPRGGEPGFVKAPDDKTLLIPDAPGNNRLDTLENVIANGRLGLLFLIPGVDETLRVNGRARLRDDASLIEQFKNEKRAPKLVIEVKVEDAYLHCAKALMRSKLWDPAIKIERSTLPSMGEMLRDQIGAHLPAETQAQMIERYKLDL